MSKSNLTRKSWEAMMKFADNQPLTPAEWEAMSWITLINRENLSFSPGNVRWATSKAERTSNLAFFKKMGVQ